MPWLFFFAALAIPAFYAVGLLARQTSTFTVTDFWRFRVVHLWVEDFLELFTTIMVAYIFVLLGIVSESVGLRVVYLDIILYSAGGVIGTMHHLYFSGEPVEHMALGAFFSAAEVIPLTFLTIEAWSFLQIGELQTAAGSTPFPHRWAIMFLVAVGFWNFLGAGIFGFLINLPPGRRTRRRGRGFDSDLPGALNDSSMRSKRRRLVMSSSPTRRGRLKR
jgi:nitric oxide reductase subunit B